MEQAAAKEELRVLMLEDSPTDAELVEHELSKAGMVFTVKRVETRDAFIRALDEFHPDVILSDYKLPDFDGMTALKMERRDHPEIPVVIVTGALPDIDAVELLNAGAKDYVLKDRLARLAPAVRHVLSAEQGIRARKAAEKALRRNMVELEEAQRIAHVGNWELDTQTGRVSWSGEVFRIFGRDPKLPAPDLNEHGQILTTDSFVQLTAAIEKTGQSGEPFQLDLELLRPDGARRWITAHGEARRDASGQIVGVRGAALDITERRHLEEELRQHRDNLEAQVSQRTADLEQRSEELQQVNRKLQELDQLKSMFIASMSHELRTPLNSIIGFTGILLQGMAGPVNEEQTKQLILVKESANHLLSLINDIIDLSKIEAGKADIVIGEFDLAEVVWEVADSFAVAVNTKKIELAVESPPTLWIECDRKRIKQILVNLVGNAVKFTNSGRIEVSVIPRNGDLEIAVQDTGIGIRQEDIGKLFTAFSQIRAEGQFTEGTGLGLYLSQKIAHILGSHVSVSSKPGKGSRFSFSLPSHPRGNDPGMKNNGTTSGLAK